MSNRHNFLERAHEEFERASEPSIRPHVKTAAVLGLGDFKNVFVAHWRVLAYATLVSLVIGLVYVIVAEREYSASTKVKVDLQKTELLPSPTVGATFLNLESALLESDLDLARSLSVLKVAAGRVNLSVDADYNRASPIGALRARISSFLKSEKQLVSSQAKADDLMLLEFANRTRIERVGQSLLIRFTYRSSNPDRAALIASAIAESFIDAQMQSQKSATSKIAASLYDRLSVMRDEVASGDTAVAKYKAEHVLAEAPGGSELERQLSDLNNQAAAAKAEAVLLRARFDRLNAAASSRDLEALASVEGSDQALAAIQTELRRVGAQGDSEASARSKENILTLVNSLLKSRRTAVEFAEARANQLSNELERVKQDVTIAAFYHVKLADLQRHADSRRVIYEATLTAFNRFVQNEALPMARFKIAEEAIAPALPNWPKAPLIMASMLLLGLSVGSGYILLREGFRQTFISTRELTRTLGVKSIAAPQAFFSHASGFDSYAAAATTPFNRMQESMVRLQYALGAGAAGGLVIGVTSALEHEGKTSVTGLFGAHLASLGMRVLLVDLGGDGALTRRLNVEPADRRSGGELPAFIHRVANYVHLLAEAETGAGSYGTRSVFSEHVASLRSSYDVVLVDLPALEDAQHLAPLLDKVVLVVEWNRTTQQCVCELLESAPTLSGKIECAVLNKVQWRKIRRSAPADFARLAPLERSGKFKQEKSIHESF